MILHKYEYIRTDMMKEGIDTIGLRNSNLSTLLGQLEGENKEDYDYRKKLGTITIFLGQVKEVQN